MVGAGSLSAAVAVLLGCAAVDDRNPGVLSVGAGGPSMSPGVGSGGSLGAVVPGDGAGSGVAGAVSVAVGGAGATEAVGLATLPMPPEGSDPNAVLAVDRVAFGVVTRGSAW